MSILDWGAGAAGGLENLLDRIMAEDTLKYRNRQLEEETRSNMAREALTGRNIDEMSKFRILQQNNMDEYRRKMDEDRDLSRVLSSAGMQPIGSQVDPKTRALQEKSGISPANYLDIFSPGISTPEGDDPNARGMSIWRGTEDQQRLENQQHGTPVSFQRDTVIIRDPEAAKRFGVTPGTPIDVDINPRTNQRLYRGQDVTDVVEHWEKPPAPTFSLFQTGDQYGLFNRRTGGITEPQAPGGGNVPLATTNATRTMSEGARMISSAITAIGEDATLLDKAGMFGPLMSRLRDIGIRLGTVQGLDSADLDTQQRVMEQFGNAVKSDPSLATDRLAGKFATELGLLASGAGRVHGGARGGGSIQMIDYLKGLLSGTSTLPMFLGRLDALQMYMDKYAAGPGGGGGKTPQPEVDPNDPMGLGIRPPVRR